MLAACDGRAFLFNDKVYSELQKTIDLNFVYNTFLR